MIECKPGPSRRQIIGAAAAASVLAGAAPAPQFVYGGWRFDRAAISQPLSGAFIASLRSQVDIVEAVNIKPAIRAFFRGIPKFIVPTTPLGPGEYSFDQRRLFLSLQIDPPQNPVLLHAYHQQRLPGGLRNPLNEGFYEQAVRSDQFPVGAYMLTNVAEFFAMCGSVVLWGQAARPPRTRRHVQLSLPGFYDWIITEFTPNGAI